MYKWFDHLKAKGHYISGYVIMPSHLHALIAFRNTGPSINTIIGNGKRFMAYEMVKRLQKQNDTKLLHRLQLLVEAKDKERNKKHEVWEDSFDWKECRTNEYMLQKLNYMHHNPCKGKWNLTAAPADYKHSSAKYYIANEQGEYEIFNYCELADVDLTKLLTDDAGSAIHGRDSETRLGKGKNGEFHAGDSPGNFTGFGHSARKRATRKRYTARFRVYPDLDLCCCTPD